MVSSIKYYSFKDIELFRRKPFHWLVIAILLIASASIIGARRQLREWEADIRCYRDKQLKCHRADRVEAVLKEKK